MQRLRSAAALALVLGAIAVSGCNRAPDAAPNASTSPGSSASSQPPTTSDGAKAPDAVLRSSTDDAAVTAKVKAALLGSDGIKGTDIAVDTIEGTVILTGKVADETQVKRAAEIAARVEGVRNVDNRLLVASS